MLSVQVGRIENIDYKGRKVRTAINKKPVTGPVKVQTLGLEGDRQADPRYHGGPNKAVYLYPSEHYPYWQEQMPGVALPFGIFGENLTTAGVLEEDLKSGLRLRIGTALFEVTKPREPCFKLGTRLDRMDLLPVFKESGRSGMYLAVIEEGIVEAGDPIVAEGR